MIRTPSLIRFLLPALALALNAGARAVTMPVPLDVNALVAKGQAKVTATEFDIADASKVFDADRSTLARTPSINPAFVQVVFDAPQTITGVRVTFTSDRHEWSLKTGAGETPDKVAATATFRGDDPQTILFKQPVTARSFRLDVHRREGDDFVHIVDLELLQPGEVSGLEVYRPKSDTDRIPDDAVTENTVLTFSARAKTADGRTLDVTRDAHWTSASPGVAPWSCGGAKNRFHLTQAGTATITATLADLTGQATVTAKPYEARNGQFDLDVLFIERTPRLDYDANPETGGWPRDGQRVGWVAHLRNWGGRDVPSVAYLWVLDGKAVHRGAIRDWKAGTETTISFPWRWEKKRHELAFVLDSDTAYPDESTKANNQVGVYTDALAVGYWVEDGLWRYFHDRQQDLGDGMNSFEDWGQRQMNRWNEMFANARYGSAPSGVLDRVRLDLVVRVPNGALPLQGGIPTNNPAREDKTVDLMWGMTAGEMGPGKFWDVKHSGPFYLEYGLIHELNHARYIVDSYGFDVHSGAVEKLAGPDGKPLFGTPVMPGQVPPPGQQNVVRFNKYRGMMGGPHYVSEHEAYGWNRVAGQRARKGNQNGPDDIGVYLEDLPQTNRFRFVDEDGKPLAGATVEVHQSRPMKDSWYGKTYVQEADATYTTDRDGWITLPRNPFGEKIVHGYGHANSTLLFIVKRGDTWRTAFQEVTDFNLAFARGYKDEARYQVALDFSPDNTTLGQTTVLPVR